MPIPRQAHATRLEGMLRWWAAPLVVIANAVFVITITVSNSPSTLIVPVSLAAAVSGGLLVICATAARERGRKLVERCDFRICPTCRYHLAGLPDDGACPECGRAYQRETLKIIWMDVYQIRNH